MGKILHSSFIHAGTGSEFDLFIAMWLVSGVVRIQAQDNTILKIV